MNRFKVEDLSLVGLKLITRDRRSDSRGFLSRIFCSEELTSGGWTKNIAQINQSFTRSRGTVRGMHYQTSPYTEMKLVSCIRGEIWDVAVDLRRKSPTFMQWHAEKLSEENGRALLIPEGFAHGFQTLVDDCELLYLHSEVYVPRAEAGLRYNDTWLSIKWPEPVTKVSERDLSHPLIDQEFTGIDFL